MYKKALFLSVILCGALLAVMASAEIYQYKDSAGATRFTNDLTKVPKDQRPHVKSFEETVSKETDPVDSDAVSDENQAEEETSDFSAPESEVLPELTKINDKKAELDKEYAGLVNEKEMLLKMKEEADTPEAKRICNEKSVELNQRISDYEVRRQAFAKDAEEFNKRIEGRRKTF